MSAIFNEDQLGLRRNIWRSLHVLDQFLAAFLGRPNAMSEGESTDDSSVVSPGETSDNQQLGQPSEAGALDTTVRICQVIGKILRPIYSKRRISPSLVQEIANDCIDWSHEAHAKFGSSKLSSGSTTPHQGMAILHIQLMGCHSKILFTQPFFFLLWQQIQGTREGIKQTAHRSGGLRIGKLAETCLAASTKTIDVIQAAFEGGYLPRSNPFVL